MLLHRSIIIKTEKTVYTVYRRQSKHMGNVAKKVSYISVLDNLQFSELYIVKNVKLSPCKGFSQATATHIISIQEDFTILCLKFWDTPMLEVVFMTAQDHADEQTQCRHTHVLFLVDLISNIITCTPFQ